MPSENFSNRNLSQSSARKVFQSAAKECTNRNFRKSYAQVAISVAPSGSPAVSPEVAPLSFAGLHPRPAKAKKRQSYGLKLREGELELLKAKAAAYRMSLNGYLRAKALGEDYIEKPPEWLRDALLKLYVELAGHGNNLNQIARQVNRQLTSGETAAALLDRQRQPVFMALEKLELALAGRRPPHDY